MSRLIHRSFVRHNKIISVNIFWTTYRSTRTIICERPLTIFASLVCKNFESSQTFPSSAWHQRSKAPPAWLSPRFETKSRRVTKAAPIKGVYTQWCVRSAVKKKAHPWEFRVHAIHTRENILLGRIADHCQRVQIAHYGNFCVHPNLTNTERGCVLKPYGQSIMCFG